jgi:hypothetical protein
MTCGLEGVRSTPLRFGGVWADWSMGQKGNRGARYGIRPTISACTLSNVQG